MLPPSTASDERPPAARGRSAALGDSFFCCELSQAGRLVGVIAGETTLRWAVDATQRREMLRVLLRGPEDGLVGPGGIRTEDSDANCKADASDVAARRAEAAASVVA